jgi:hypothetical protein
MMWKKYTNSKLEGRERLNDHGTTFQVTVEIAFGRQHWAFWSLGVIPLEIISLATTNFSMHNRRQDVHVRGGVMIQDSSKF